MTPDHYRWTYEEAIAQPHNVLAGAYDRAENNVRALQQDITRLNARIIQLIEEVERLQANAASKA